MNNWYKLDLGDRTESPKRILEFQELFRPIYFGAPPGSGRALIYRFNEVRNMGEMFFTPQNRDFALANGAVSCPKPSIGEGRLISMMGDEDTSTYFPDQEPS